MRRVEVVSWSFDSNSRNRKLQIQVEGYAVYQDVSAMAIFHQLDFSRVFHSQRKNWLAHSRGSSCMSSVIRAPEAK